MEKVVNGIYKTIIFTLFAALVAFFVLVGMWAFLLQPIPSLLEPAVVWVGKGQNGTQATSSSSTAPLLAQ